MSNPTERPDLDKLEALARAATPGPWHNQSITDDECQTVGLSVHAEAAKYPLIDEDHMPGMKDAEFIATANPAAVLGLIALARRAQPEGEAPQADDVAEVVAVWLRYGQAVIEFTGNPPSVGDKFHRAPAATLSPLCGAQHAESGKEAASEAHDELRRKFIASITAATSLGETAVWGLARQLLDDAVAALAAQQAAAPGTLDDLDFTPDAHHQVADMANVGYELMQTIKAMRPDYCWNDTPAEIVSDLINELDEATTSAPGTPEAPNKPAHGHRDDYYLLANGRRLGLESISRVRNMPNWVLAMELFATGSTSAHQICRDAGIDPDSTTIQRAAQLDGGQGDGK